MYTIKFINCLLNFPPLTCLSVCFFQFGVFEMSNNFWGNLGRSLLRQGYPNSDDPIASMIQDFFGESYARTDNNHTRSTSEPTTFNYTHHRNPALAQHQPSSAARQTSESITTPSSHSCHRNSTSSQQQLTTVAVAAISTHASFTLYSSVLSLQNQCRMPYWMNVLNLLQKHVQCCTICVPPPIIFTTVLRHLTF